MAEVADLRRLEQSILANPVGAEEPVKITPPGTSISQGEKRQPPPRPRFSRKRLAAALAIAAVSDVLSGFLVLMPPVQWAVDLVTAASLFMVLGRQWILLPGLIAEAIPGLYVFPFWVLVVSTVALGGTARPRR